MMFLKSMIVVDPDQDPKDLEALLDAMNNNVHIATDIIVLDGMVADSLEAASPYENVHSKILIDATTLTERDPRSSNEPLEGSFKQEVPAWRQGLEAPPAFDNLEAVLGLEDVSDARMLRESMLVVTTNIPDSPSPREGSSSSNDEAESARIGKILQLRNQIWQLKNSDKLRWLFITNDDLDLHCEKARRRLLWQLTSRFDVAVDSHLMKTKSVCVGMQQHRFHRLNMASDDGLQLRCIVMKPLRQYANIPNSTNTNGLRI